MPAVITCPTEMVALSAAHGFAQVTGCAQAVLVHVDCGTQSLAGAVHNAPRGRVPVLIFAGTSPSTQHGELAGSRNEFIHWIQDTFDQRGLVRGYTKYSHEFRTAEHVREITTRAVRFAGSDPKGPVYLVAAREVMEQAARGPQAYAQPGFVTAGGLRRESAARIAAALATARRPPIVTSYIGRNPAAVAALSMLAQRLGIGILESVPNYMNISHDCPLYLGNQWNEPQQNVALAEVDVVLVIDSDVPWIPLFNRPSDGAAVFHIDVDPLKQHTPLAAIAAEHSFQADAETAIGQIIDTLDLADIDTARADERRAHYQWLHEVRRGGLLEKEARRGDELTPEGLTAAVRNRIGPNAIVVNEGISNYQAVFDHIAPTVPGSMFTSGGGSLGWSGGAAFGMKLARPEKLVVALTGDGSYLMSLPASVHWLTRRYRAPILQVIYNNGGWKSPKLSAFALHPSGFASSASELGVSLDPPADYVRIAEAAGGALARTVRTWQQLDDALDEAVDAVSCHGRSAVIDARLPQL